MMSTGLILTMGAVSLALISMSCSASSAPVYSEPANFNVTQALFQYGVDVSELPELTTLHDRSSHPACSVAVSPPSSGTRLTCLSLPERLTIYLQCKSLRTLYGAESLDTPGSTSYSNFTASYWSALQEEVSPTCIFYPATTTQVSVLVLLSRLTQCPFAAKSGGHAAFPGASSIEGGITVSFRNLSSISLSADRKTASVQPGNTWYTVYSTLAPYNLAVLGGRVSPIGVGGLVSFPFPVAARMSSVLYSRLAFPHRNVLLILNRQLVVC